MAPILGGASDGNDADAAHGAVEEGARARDCRTQGVCVCSDEGKKALIMSKSFMAQFKPLVKRGSTGRLALVEGRRVLKLHWEEVRPLGGAEPAVGAAALDALVRSGHFFLARRLGASTPLRATFPCAR